MRLDQYAAQHWPEHSRSTWQKLIKQGFVTVNGQVVNVPKHELRDTDIVEAQQPKAPDFSKNTLPIIYEDDNVIVVNKPIGVLTHSKGALNDEFTVAEFFRPYTTFAVDSDRPGIIHRLDRDTSGVLLGAKNPETAKLLSRQFAQRKTKKQYVAVLDGIPAEQQAIIDLPIDRNPSKPSTFRVSPEGKQAETSYVVQKNGDKRCLVQLMPKTGRTHQLRVHMAYLGTPIRGDVVYGKAASRLFLHAHTLEVTLPGGNRTVFEAPVPPEFEREVL